MKTIFNWALAIFTFLMATFFITGETFSHAQGLVYLGGIAALFMFSLYLKPLRNVINPWVNSILALGLLVFLAGDMKAKPIMVEGLVRMMLGVMLFYLVANHCGNRKLIYNAICAVAVVSFLMVILQRFNLDPICLNDQAQPNTHPTALYGYKHDLGAYMALATPLLLFNRRILFGTLAGATCVISESWTAIGCMVIGILFAAFYFNKKLFIISLILILIGSGIVYTKFLYKPEQNLDIGYKLWVRAKFQTRLLKVVSSRPYFGTGLGTFPYLGEEVLVDEQLGALTDAWNDYLERLIEMGPIIIFLILGLYYYVWQRFRGLKIDLELAGIMGALVTIPIGIAFHTYVNYPSVITICIIVLGIFEARVSDETNI